MSVASTFCRVLPIPGLVSNVFAIQGQRTVIVDAGMPGRASRSCAGWPAGESGPDDVSLILLTHGHLDHFGSAAELRRLTRAPIAIHPADAPALHAGHNPPIVPRVALAPSAAAFFSAPPHRRLPGGFAAGRWPAARRVRRCRSGDRHARSYAPARFRSGCPSRATMASGELIAGDLLMGGGLGGLVAPRQPRLPYFYDDLEPTRQSIDRILALPLPRLRRPRWPARRCGRSPRVCRRRTCVPNLNRRPRRKIGLSRGNACFQRLASRPAPRLRANGAPSLARRPASRHSCLHPARLAVGQCRGSPVDRSLRPLARALPAARRPACPADWPESSSWPRDSN